MNIVAITGRITRTPAVEEVGKEKKFKKCSFTLMVKTKRKNDKGFRSDPIQCEALGQIASTLEKHVVQGSPISLTGEMRTDSWGEGESFRQRTYLHVDSLEIQETRDQTEVRKRLLEEKENTPSYPIT